jgi:hypothetical protein
LAIGKIPELIEKHEPVIESQLVQALNVMNPEEASLFLVNWDKINAVVQRTLAPPDVGARRKRTRRRYRKRRS